MLKLGRKLRWEFAELIDREVAATLEGARGTPPAQNRLEAVGMTISTALPAAVEAWRPAAQRLGVRVRLVGAFSFGAPQVEFADSSGAARACALADVMILVDDLRTSNSARRAMLVRTVLAAAGGFDHDDCDREASELYETWPAFRFRSEILSDAVRRLGERSAAETASLALISLRPGSAGWKYRGPAPSDRAKPGMSFGALLTAMAIGSAGRQAMRSGQDDWSLTIDQLLRRTASATLSGLSAPSAELRAATTFAGECGTGHVLLENRSGLASDAAGQVHRLEGPISVVHLVVDELTGASGSL